MNFHALEHKILKVIRDEKLESSSLLLAISGGRDSMVMLHVMARLARVAKLSLRCVHIHHGPSKSLQQGRFRDQAQKFCQKQAKKFGLPFITNVTNSIQRVGKESEGSLREFRLNQIQQIRKKDEDLVLAHHAQDLLETRFMRLIRGVSPQGLVAMKIKSKNRFRPFLGISSQEIQNYADEFKVNYVEDPSNCDLGPLRNWLRHDWLPKLERKRPGSLMAFSRTFESLLLSEKVFERKKLGPHFSREILDLLPRKTALLHLRELYKVSYGLRVTESQVSEVLKQLYIGKKKHRFKIGGVSWEINAGQVATSREMLASS